MRIAAISIILLTLGATVPAFGDDILEKPKKLKDIQTAVFWVPSNSTFFWDQNPIRFKRQNPQGLGKIDLDKSKQFKEAIKLQGGITLVDMEVNNPFGKESKVTIDEKEHMVFLLCDWNKKTMTNGLEHITGQVGLFMSKPAPELNTALAFLKYRMDFHSNQCLYIVHRSRSSTDNNNFVIVVEPIFENPAPDDEA